MPSKADYEKFFTDADTDGSGSLSFDELVGVLRKRGYRGTNAELKQFFASTDTSGDNMISKDEYMVAMGQQPPEEHGRYNDMQSANDRPISGRLPVATHRQDRLIVISHLCDTPRPTGHTSAVPPGRNNPRFSKLTVRRRFHSSYLSGRRSHRGPVLSPLHHLEGDHTGVRSSALSTIWKEITQGSRPQPCPPSGRRSHRGPVLSPLHHLEGDHTGVRSTALSTIWKEITQGSGHQPSPPSGRRSHRGPVLSPLHHLEGDHTGVRSSALSTIWNRLMAVIRSNRCSCYGSNVRSL
ncbi:hypothetical protein LSAT2_018915 [Lamellibrachia satsuma]|nr:hypothetical protein LSAT2_018915 [Lamellibrachia satsuma]